MIGTFRGDDIVAEVHLSDGDTIVLLDRLAQNSRYSNEDCARNIVKIDRQGRIRWVVRSNFDAEGNPFTQLHSENGELTAYRWDGGTYRVDVATGLATPLVLER